MAVSGEARTVLVARCGCCGSERSVAAGQAQGGRLLRCSACRTLRFEAVAPSADIYRDGYHLGVTPFGWDYANEAERPYEEALAAVRIGWVGSFHLPGRLLDVGGGLGYLVAEAARRGWDATLLEPVAHAVEHAQRVMGVRAVQGDSEALPTLPGGWDVIAFVHSLEHVLDPLRTLRAARDMLAPGGIVFVELPNVRSLSRLGEGDAWLGWRAGEHVHLFDRGTLVGLAERAGIEPIAARSFVPGWDGMVVDGYAHMLGLQRALWRAVRAKRRAAAAIGAGRSRGGPGAERTEAGAAGATVPAATGSAPPRIRQTRGLQRLVYGTGFKALARLEETTGLGTYLQLIGRPATPPA